MRRSSVRRFRSRPRVRVHANFEAGTKRRLSDEEVSELPWRELEMNILCKITSLWINAGRWGASATPEAILVKRCDVCPFDDDVLENFD